MERGDWARLWLIKGLQGAKWPVVERQPSWVFCPFTGLCDKKGWLDWKLCWRWFEFTWLSMVSNQKLISPFENSLSCFFGPMPMWTILRACFGGYHAPRNVVACFSNHYCWKHCRFVCLLCIEFFKNHWTGDLSMVITGHVFWSLPVPLSLVDLDLAAVFTWQQWGSQ